MIPLNDLAQSYRSLKPEIDAAVLRVLSRGWYILGEEGERLEAEFARYCGARHGVGCGSGTEALHLALAAAGLRPGDEVATSPLTAVPTVSAIELAGGRPVFCDVDPETLTLAPGALERLLERRKGKKGSRLRAVVPVHLYGQPCAMGPIRELAAAHSLLVVEDAAQSHGAAYGGKKVGTLGLAAAFSFYPTKNLGAAGEGGMVLTSDPALDEKVRLLRCHGARAAYLHDMVGVNSHLPALQAAVLRVKLRHLDRWNDLRRRHALRYAEALGGAEGVSLPVELPGYRHIYHQYVVRIPRRDEAKALFQAEGVGCGVFYPVPLHRQACFAAYSGDASCPVADKACGEVLALPVYPELTDGQVDTVADLLRRHVGVSD